MNSLLQEEEEISVLFPTSQRICSSDPELEESSSPSQRNLKGEAEEPEDGA